MFNIVTVIRCPDLIHKNLRATIKHFYSAITTAAKSFLPTVYELFPNEHCL